MMYLQINAQVGQAILGSGYSFVGYTWYAMLMVGSNQNFQWRHRTSVEGMLGAKLIARSYLEKQLVMNLPLDACGWAGQSRTHV